MIEIALQYENGSNHTALSAGAPAAMHLVKAVETDRGTDHMIVRHFGPFPFTLEQFASFGESEDRDMISVIHFSLLPGLLLL